MKNRKYLVLLMFIFFGVSKLFSLSGQDILDEMENSISGPEDMEGSVTMILANSDGSDYEEREMKMWVAGEDTRMIKFISPTSVRNIGLLVLDSDEMYLYMPSTRSVRRISGSSQSDDFQGTDFSYEEIGSYEYSDEYTADIESEDDETWTLNLTIGDDSDSDYDQIIMEVLKDNYMPQLIEMYTDGELIKRMEVFEIEDNDGYLMPSHVKIENLEKGHYTEMIMTELIFDQGLVDDDYFTQRQLKRATD